MDDARASREWRLQDDTLGNAETKRIRYPNGVPSLAQCWRLSAYAGASYPMIFYPVRVVSINETGFLDVARRFIGARRRNSFRVII